MAKIKDYLSTIQDKIIPLMIENYNINFKTEPILLRPTAVTYMGFDNGNNRIMLEFNSEYKESNKSLIQTNELFATVFFRFTGAKAGIIDINNPNEASEILYSTLYELGFRTSQDIEEDKANQEKAAEEKRLAKEKEIQDAREREKKRHELMNNKPDIEEPEEVDETQVTYTQALDITLTDFKERHEINSNLHYTYLVPETKKQDVFDVDIYYVSRNKCYIKSEYLNLDKTYDLDDLKEFLLDLYEKYTPKVVTFYSASDELIDNYILA